MSINCRLSEATVSKPNSAILPKRQKLHLHVPARAHTCLVTSTDMYACVLWTPQDAKLSHSLHVKLTDGMSSMEATLREMFVDFSWVEEKFRIRLQATINT